MCEVCVCFFMLYFGGAWYISRVTRVICTENNADREMGFRELEPDVWKSGEDADSRTDVTGGFQPYTFIYCIS